MAITWTYATLLARVEAELARDDLTTDFPYWLSLAENRISREVKPRGFEVYVTSTLTTSDPYVTPPARIKDMIAFFVIDADGDRKIVKRRTYSWLRSYTPAITTLGLPKFYSDMGSIKFIVGPTPDANYTFELAYFEELQPLDANNTTNWLTENAADLLFYGTLLESAPALRSDPRIQTWTVMFDRYKQSLQAQELMFNTDRAAGEIRQ